MRIDQQFSRLKSKLTKNDIEQISEIVCKRCRIATWNRVRANLTYHPSAIPNFGILDRLYREDNGTWSYCAGQSYPDEIRTLRGILRDLR